MIRSSPRPHRLRLTLLLELNTIKPIRNPTCPLIVSSIHDRCVRHALVYRVLQLTARKHLTCLVHGCSGHFHVSIAVLVTLNHKHGSREGTASIRSDIRPPLGRLGLVPSRPQKLNAFGWTEKLRADSTTRLNLKRQFDPRDPSVSHPFRKREVVSNGFQALRDPCDSRVELAGVLSSDVIQDAGEW